MLNPSDLDQLLNTMPLISATVSMTKPLEHIYSGAPIMFISAYRYGIPEHINKQNNKHLLKKIQSTNYNYICFDGYWTPYNKETETYDDGNAYHEESFMVVGINRLGVASFEDFKQTAIKWCSEFKQDSVLIGKADRQYTNTDRRYRNVPITFCLIQSDGICQNEFTELHFDTKEKIKEIHDYYINSIFNNHGKSNEGFAHTTDKKNKNTFRMMDKEESDARKEFYAINSELTIVDSSYRLVI